MSNTVAFANTNGGTLYIGVDDDGNEIGVKDPKGDLKRISDTIANKFAILPEVHIDGSTDVISIIVRKANVPVELNGQFYIRTGNTVHEAKGREFDRIMSQRMNTPWLDQPIMGMDETELDRQALEYFRDKARRMQFMREESIAVPDRELLTRLGLMTDGNVTRAGVLLFHPYPDDYIVGSFTKIGMFVGSEILYQDVIGGPLVTRFDRLLDVLKSKYLIRPISYSGLLRVENDQYPEESLRECLINALIHNDYSSLNPVQIRVESDRLIVTDFGGVPSGWDTEMLISSNKSMPVNPSIAQTFYKMGFIENWGRGIKRVLDGYRDYNDRKVVIDADMYSFQVRMDALITEKEVLPMIKASSDGTTRTWANLEGQRILEFLDNEGEKAICELAAMLDVTSKASVSKVYLRPMLDAGFIEYTILKFPEIRTIHAQSDD